MRPRRDIFGLTYVGELVEDYLAQAARLGVGKEELQWAHNVLTEYFSVVDVNHPKIQIWYQQFTAFKHTATGDGLFKPYKRGASITNSVNPRQLRALALQRRSVRWFENKTIDRGLISEAAEIASLAPSACNRQPFKLIVIDDPEKLSKAVKLPMGTAGWEHNIPMFAVFVGDFSSFEEPRDRHVPYIDASLAAMNFMLALETLGLSSCPINWPDIEPKEKAMAELLNLNSWERPIMCLAVGYADETGGIAFSQKKTAHQIIQYV